MQKMMNIIIYAFFISHLVACLFYLIARIDEFNGDTWVARFDLTERSVFMKYITAYYWTFQTLTTVGYGDIPCVTIYEQLLAIVWMICGVGCYSVAIGNLGGIILDINHHTKKLSEI